MVTRKPYPSDVSDEEWAFVAPYLALVREDAPQRDHDLREVFNALRWVVRTGSAWRYMPHDLPPWEAVYQQTQRWLKAGVFEEMVHDLRVLLRLSKGKASEPTAAILDSRTLRSTPRAVPGAATTATRARKVRRCTPPWTPWDTCSPCA
jgi:transposase